MIALQKPPNLIPLKKTGMQGAKFSRNEAYLPYAAVTGKLKQRRRSGFFSGIKLCTSGYLRPGLLCALCVLSEQSEAGGANFRVSPVGRLIARILRAIFVLEGEDLRGLR